MEALFASGRAIDIVLAVLAIEAFWLMARGHAPARVLYALGPGALMVLAVRFALTGQPWPWIAAALAASFPLHLLDLLRRGRLGPRRRDIISSSARR